MNLFRSQSARRSGWLVALFTLLMTTPLWAERIGDLEKSSVGEQLMRLLRFEDPTILIPLLGCLLLGLNCGVLGSYVVVRKMALVGDTLSHAVLPGIAIGFLWTSTRNPLVMLAGATTAGFFGVFVVHLLTKTTRLKRDTALGLVLSSFYAVGVVLISMMKESSNAGKAGLQSYYLGQAAAISREDLVFISVVTLLIIALIILFYRPFLLLSFDREYGTSCGLPLGALHYVLMLLITVAIVVSLQAVGIILVSALLVIPAAAAYLLTDRMHRLILYSALIGMLAAGLGVFMSYLGSNLPTGPFIVLAASTLFFAAFLFGPKYGFVVRQMRHRSRTRQTERENTLKAVYKTLEERGFDQEGVELHALAKNNREDIEATRRKVRELTRADLATTDDHLQTVYLTPEGMQVASSIVRNHRLWELYLTDVADYEPDHVHDDAEKIEHILGEETVRALEKQLAYPTEDPHGKPIPEVEQTMPLATAGGGSDEQGYRPDAKGG